MSEQTALPGTTNDAARADAARIGATQIGGARAGLTQFGDAETGGAQIDAAQHDAMQFGGVRADDATVWAALGAAGAIRGVYPDPPSVDANRLAAVLSTLDAKYGIGETLGVCVQLATAVPLLIDGARRAADGPVTQARDAALDGTSVTALAATDRGAGSDLADLNCRVDIDGDRITLHGGKRWITNATRADQILVLARQRPGRHFTNFSWVLVPADAPGVRCWPADTDAFDGAALGHIDLDGVRLDRRFLVGRPGTGLAVFARHVTTERLAGALWATAVCRRVIASTVDRLRKRRVGDGPLWNMSGPRLAVSEATVRMCGLEALCRDLGARVVDSYDAAAAAVLKVAAARTTAEVLDRCAPLWGADGFAHDGPQRLRAQTAVFGIGGGTVDIVLGTVAEHLDTLIAGTRIGDLPIQENSLGSGSR